jgi:hypothetical protein
MLRVLFAEEATDPYLTGILTATVPTITERVNADLARADWDASRLRLALSGRAVARTGSIADNATGPPDSS